MAKGPRSPQRSTQEIENEIWAAPYVDVNLGAASRGNIRASEGKVRSLTCFNDSSATRFFHMINTSATPTDDYTPDDMWLLPPDSQVIVGTDYFGQYGLEYDQGISWVFSYHANSAMSATAADCTSFIKYM